MRISLRTSGGRGEYELAGCQKELKNSDLSNRHFFFELSPELRVDGYAVLRIAQGKPRIRITDKTKGKHTYLLLSSILLLPKPIRERHKTPKSDDILVSEKYSILGIDVDVVEHNDEQAVLRPKHIYAGNSSTNVIRMDVAGRMALVQRLWSEAESLKGDLAQRIGKHHDAIIATSPNHRDIEKAASKVWECLGKIKGDILDAALHKLTGDIIRPEDEQLQKIDLERQSDIWKRMEADEESASESAREQIRQWRQIAARGAKARQFSDDVKQAYNYRCAFSGIRMPSIPELNSPGVDAAHILPWARYNINVVSNGLCLCKACHWAFDAGLLRLDWNDEDYVLSIPDSIITSATKEGFDLGFFQQLCGILPKEYMPTDKRLWPSPEYISKLNRSIFGK